MAYTKQYTLNKKGISELLSLFGKMPKKTELASFYRVTKGAVSQWSKETVELKAIYMKLKQAGIEFQK